MERLNNRQKAYSLGEYLNCDELSSAVGLWVPPANHQLFTDDAELNH